MEKINKDQQLSRLHEKMIVGKLSDYNHMWLQVSYCLVKDDYIRMLSPVAFAVFITLRAYMNKSKVTYPRLTTISKNTGCTVKTVQKQIKKLEQAGWIRRMGRQIRNDGKYGVMQYLILQNDLVRGAGDSSFLEKPVVKNTNGVPSLP